MALFGTFAKVHFGNLIAGPYGAEEATTLMKIVGEDLHRKGWYTL